MFLELMATVFAGIAVAGVVMALNKISGGRLPRWAAPVGAGLGMIALTISMEYTWYGRTAASLPEGVEIAETIENQSFYRPWTYLAPYVERFVAVDTTSLKRHTNVPDQRMMDVYFFGRWAAVRRTPVLVDCVGQRRAALIDGMNFDADGQVVNAPWIAVQSSDPVLAAVCDVS